MNSLHRRIGPLVAVSQQSASYVPVYIYDRKLRYAVSYFTNSPDWWQPTKKIILLHIKYTAINHKGLDIAS